ncbi:MAG: winged helix DNA-binding domain-containing protein [Armatimonadota bacterium]
MSHPILTQRALNRALLARQMLLRRKAVSAVEAIERLAGLQAQQARPPFVGLWCRLEEFRREELVPLLHSGQVVRAPLMRCTLHLWSRRDFTALRPAIQPALDSAVRSILRERLDALPLETVLAEARRLYAERPRTFTELRNELLARFPGADERAMGYTVRTQLPLVLVPGSHEWGYRADCEFALAEEWLGHPLDTADNAHTLVLRYLAAFGPASAADVTAWSGRGGLAPVLEELRPRLAVFRDERNRELFDLPEAPRPPEETPAPPRFVADFDNLILSHADRTRVIADEHRKTVITKNALVLPTFLVDGFVAGTWKVTRQRKTAILTLSPFGAVPEAAREELTAEGDRLARFVEPAAVSCEVRWESR